MAIVAREKSYPSTATYVNDFGLNVTPPAVQRNKRIVVLGTAEDGPMYEPVQIEKPEDAEFVWGRKGAGDLVRGISEAWDVQGGYPTVVGVRIGNGNKAKLEIEETTGSTVDEEQGGNFTSLKLEALYPGSIYNGVSVSYNDNREVAIYNPKTGIISTFTIDTSDPNNPNVDAHNVAELVDAINSNTNTNSAVVASYSGILADFEIAVNSSSAGVNSTNRYVDISLPDVIDASLITTSGYLNNSPINGEVTAANDIIEVESVEAVSISEWEKLGSAGQAVNSFSIMPLDGKSPNSWKTIQAMYDYDSDDNYMKDPSGNYVSEYIFAVENALMDGGEGEGGPTRSGGYWSGGTSTQTIKVSVPLCLDDSEETSNSGIANGYIVGNADYDSYQGNWRYATCSGVEKKLVNGRYLRPSGKIEVQASTGSDPNGFWQTLTYSTDSGIYLSSYDSTSGVATFAIGPTASGNPIMQTLVYDSTNTIRDGVYLRVNANTVKGTLTEKENLNALTTTSSTLTDYFVRGQEVVFNTPPAYNMYVNYGTKIRYEVGANVDLANPNDGLFTFSNSGQLPGPGGGALSANTSYIRFKYRFMPTFPNITSAAKAMFGGTDGNILNGRQRKEEFKKSYENLRNYGADLWVPMGAYIDEITERFNPVTGIKENVPVGYTSDLEEFMEDLSINNIQPHAILGVTPMQEVTQSSKDAWVKKLTVRDIKDPNRGANIMNQIQSKFISVVTFEPVFLNIGRGRPYVANGQAAYAGMLASMPYNISPTNKSIAGITNLRFSLSSSQYEALNSNRYVTMKARPNRDPVIVEDVTAAPVGSDFVNWTTWSITSEATNRIYYIAETYIGKPNDIEVRASLEQSISNALMSMDGLRDFDFSITSTPTQQVLGIIEVDLILVAVFQIKKIRTSVKLRKNLPVQ